MSNNITNETESTFNTAVIEQEQLVVVDFWAEWCGPCKMIAPIIEKLADTYEGKVKFVKVDADAYPALVGKYGVMSIPTLMFFKNGDVVARTTGFVPENQIEGYISTHM